MIKHQRERLTSSVRNGDEIPDTQRPRPEGDVTPRSRAPSCHSALDSFACALRCDRAPTSRLTPRLSVATRHALRGCSRLAQSLKLLSLVPPSIWLFKCRAHSSSVAGADCCARAFTLHACRGDRRGTRRTRRVDELVAAIYRCLPLLKCMLMCKSMCARPGSRLRERAVM